MRSFLRLCAVGVLAATAAGCDTGSVEEGVPKDIDMKKDYSPKVDMPGMSPKAAKEAKTEALKEKKEADAAAK